MSREHSEVVDRSESWHVHVPVPTDAAQRVKDRAARYHEEREKERQKGQEPLEYVLADTVVEVPSAPQETRGVEIFSSAVPSKDMYIMDDVEKGIDFGSLPNLNLVIES